MSRLKSLPSDIRASFADWLRTTAIVDLARAGLPLRNPERTTPRIRLVESQFPCEACHLTLAGRVVVTRNGVDELPGSAVSLFAYVEYSIGPSPKDWSQPTVLAYNRIAQRFFGFMPLESSSGVAMQLAHDLRLLIEEVVATFWDRPSFAERF